MIRARMRALLPALLPALGLICACGAEAGTPPSMAPVVCSLNRPVVARHHSVGAQVFAPGSAGTRLSYRWTATAGVIGPAQADASAAAGSAITWSAGDAAPGSYRISAEVLAAQGSVGSCTLDVIVSETDRSASPGTGGLPARDLLVHGRHEAGHYGLYSYILFGARPGDDMRDRFMKVLQAYFLSFEDVHLESEIPADQINVNYVPVAEPPPADADAGWVLDNYDYARAEAFVFGLRNPASGCLHGHQGDGPFLVSALQPLGSAGETKMLCQDLSTVPPGAVQFWIAQYAHQMDQQRVWNGKAIDSLPLRLRTLVAVVAEGMPMATKAVRIWFTTGAAS
jgi:hypothetical protein